MNELSSYIALGDSMSIDFYAGPGLGAASLLYRNDDQLWPEFAGKDLFHRAPHCRLQNLARNGAAIRHVEEQAQHIEPSEETTLVTLTVGGNDLLNGLGSPAWPFSYFEASLPQLLQRLRALRPNSTMLVGNIYDPSEGTGVVQSGHDLFAAQLQSLPALNRSILAIAASHGAVPIDIHRHFVGHAISDDEWIFRDIEPTRRGSSEIRRLWYEALPKKEARDAMPGLES